MGSHGIGKNMSHKVSAGSRSCTKIVWVSSRLLKRSKPLSTTTSIMKSSSVSPLHHVCQKPHCHLGEVTDIIVTERGSGFMLTSGTDMFQKISQDLKTFLIGPGCISVSNCLSDFNVTGPAIGTLVVGLSLRGRGRIQRSVRRLIIIRGRSASITVAISRATTIARRVSTCILKLFEDALDICSVGGDCTC
jgi:hypothetical protein